ncbi:hypothetical protein CO662_28910 [Rhizobium anhuiense]|uniref:ABC transporter permease n=1 Tax=Rhizobium anhuiense TaxID=1184720 RepID=A0ABX4J343_9HYPH|nr:hypothetical protein CO662_28910 [Rhizobium anhuiense]
MSRGGERAVAEDEWKPETSVRTVLHALFGARRLSMKRLLAMLLAVILGVFAVCFRNIMQSLPQWAL